MALEHNGDAYSCDHYVEPRYLLGNIKDDPVGEVVSSPKQRAFGQDKTDSLPSFCQECEFLFTCHGECPKNRVLTTPDGEPGLNWLCAGLRKFFAHTRQEMQIMAQLLERGQQAEGIMPILARARQQQREKFKDTGRNDPCPCGSGMKYKKCCGKL